MDNNEAEDWYDEFWVHHQDEIELQRVRDHRERIFEEWLAEELKNVRFLDDYRNRGEVKMPKLSVDERISAQGRWPLGRQEVIRVPRVFRGDFPDPMEESHVRHLARLIRQMKSGNLRRIKEQEIVSNATWRKTRKGNPRRLVDTNGYVDWGWYLAHRIEQEPGRFVVEFV